MTVCCIYRSKDWYGGIQQRDQSKEVQQRDQSKEVQHRDRSGGGNGEEQYDSGIFSDNGDSEQLASNVLDKLDRLKETLIRSSKVTTTVETKNRAEVGENEEDREIRKLLFRKLAIFRNKHNRDNKT